MTMTDPIADMLNKNKKCKYCKHETVDIPASNMKESNC